MSFLSAGYESLEFNDEGSQRCCGGNAILVKGRFYKSQGLITMTSLIKSRTV